MKSFRELSEDLQDRRLQLKQRQQDLGSSVKQKGLDVQARANQRAQADAARLAAQNKRAQEADKWQRDAIAARRAATRAREDAKKAREKERDSIKQEVKRELQQQKNGDSD